MPTNGTDAVEPLILDLLAWLAAKPRPYTDVMDAWRTSCPRLPVWEEAVDRKYIERTRAGTGVPLVTVTALGKKILQANKRVSVL